MPRLNLLAVPVVLAGAAAALAAGQPARADLVIRNIHVVDVERGGASPRTVVVRSGAIAAVLDGTAAPPEAASSIDGTGRFLIPGLWDMHVHLAMRPEPELAERIMLPALLAHGVVGVRDMGGPLERVLALRDGVRSGRLTGPTILAAGPFVDGPGDPDPAFRRVSTAADARAAVRGLARAGVDFIKVQAGLSAEAHAAVLAEAADAGTHVAGHVPLSLTALQAAEAGQRSIEHLSPALPGDAMLLVALSPREGALRSDLLALERERASLTPERVRAREAALRDDLITSFEPSRAQALGQALRRSQTWIVPTLIWSNSFRPLSAGDRGADLPLDLVPLATRTRWVDGRERYLKSAPPEAFASAKRVADVSARAAAALHAAGASVLAGTDTMDAFVLPGISLHQELALLTAGGLTPLQALRTATRNPAEFRGVSEREGSITAGARADLVILTANPLEDIRNTRQIAAVVLHGRLFSRPDLDRLLASARAAAR